MELIAFFIFTEFVQFAVESVQLLLGYILGTIITLLIGGQFKDWYAAITAVNTIKILTQEVKLLKEENKQLKTQNEMLRDENGLLKAELQKKEQIIDKALGEHTKDIDELKQLIKKANGNRDISRS